jgi:flagellar motor switch protein FliG
VAETNNLSGAERGAVLLMSLGEETAAQILRFMEPREVQRLGTAMAALGGISKAEVAAILNEFVDMVEDQTALGVGNEDYIRSVMTRALGDEKASGLLSRILVGRDSSVRETLKWTEPKVLAGMIRNEHPQIVAIVLSFMDSDQAAEVLDMLPEESQPEILTRVALLDRLPPSALDALDEILEQQMVSKDSVQAAAPGGVHSAAGILNFMGPSREPAILEGIRAADEDLARRIEDLMFVFDNLLQVDDRGIQALLREINNETLLFALKGADEPLREKFFRNMSKRAVEILRDDMEVRGPVRLSEVESAQKEILTTARRMADAGELVLGGESFV